MKKESKNKKDNKSHNTSKQSSKPNQKSKPKQKKNPISKFSKPKAQVIEYFPRGSGPNNDFSSNIGLYDPSKKKSFLTKKRRQEKSLKSDQNSKKSKNNEKSLEPEQPAGVMAPHFKVGDLVLLSICEIHKDYMIMNYTRNKKAMVHSSYSGLTEGDEDFSFEKYFSIGQFIVGAVVSPGNDIRLPDGRLNKKFQVSIDPKIINTGLVAERIIVGMDLYGQLIFDKNKNKYNANFKIVSSKKKKFDEDNEEEDENMSDNEEQKDNDKIEINLIDNDDEEDKKLLLNKKINSYYFFKVIKAFYNKKKKYQIDISMNLDKYHFPIKTIDFNYLRPGFLFKADVMRTLVNGVEIAFGSNLGTIFSDHIQNEKKEKNIMVRVIHLSLNKKLASLSSLSNIKKLYDENIPEKEKLIGTICSTKVNKILYGGSCQVELSTIDENNEKKVISSNSFLHCKNFPHIKLEKKEEKEEKEKKEKKKEEKGKKEKKEDNKEEEDEDSDENNDEENSKEKKDNEAREIISGIKKEVKEGDEFEKVMIKEYNFFDDRPIITTNLSSTNGEFISYETIKVGQFVTCLIKHIEQNTLHVTINKYIQGKIPLIHLTDYPLNKMPLKFKLGQTIKARVFLYNKETKNLILTMKESLLSPEVNLYSDLKDMKEGESVYVVYLGNGLYSHSNNIIGTLKNSKSVKEKELKIGKLYKFNIFKINLKSKKILFTKGNEVWVPNCGDYESFVKRNQIMSNIITVLNTLVTSEIEKINEGEIYEFKLVDIESLIKNLIKKGVNSKLLEENQNALINEFIVVRYNLENSNLGNYYGFLIKEQISDYSNDIIFKNMQKYTKEENDENKKYKMLVLYHDKETKNLFLSMKQSLIDNKENIIHINDKTKDITEQKFEQNKTYYGFVNKKNDKGITVQFYGKKKLLIKPKENTYNYHPGQTILCKYRKNKFYINSEEFCTYSKDEYINESCNKLFYYLKDISYEEDISINNDLKSNDNIKVTIGSIEDEFILSKDKDNNDIYICSNLYDFNYKESGYNLPELSKGDKIDIKLKRMKKDNLEMVLGEMPEVLINKLIENGNKLKLEFENESLNIGDEVLCRITSVKEKYIYTLINNKYIGRMDIDNYQGNLEKIKKLLKETIGLRKMSVESKGSTGSNVTNNYPKELLINAEIIDIIKLQNKLSSNELGINKNKKIKKLKIYQIVQQIDMNNEINIEEDNDKSNSGLTNDPVSTSLDGTGNDFNIGIISAIRPLNKCPIVLKIKNYSENKLQVPFNEIPLNMVKDDGDLKYKLGHKVKFYFYKNKNDLCTIIPQEKKEKNQDIKIGQKYLARILKKLDGKGIIISIRKDIETFVDICEIT